MTINEFIEYIEQNRDRLEGTEQLAVRTGGGIGSSGRVLDNPTLGFDWNHGKLMFVTEVPLTIDREAIEREKKYRAKNKGAKR